MVILANQPRVKGGVLFVDSADKAARFIDLCDAVGIPLRFLSDVPGFRNGSAVEKQGIIRHGAKMISAMSGPGFDPDATLVLPTASIAVMGAEKPEAERAAYIQQLRDEYNEDIDLTKLAADLHLEAIVDPLDLRSELIARFARARRREPIVVKRKRVGWMPDRRHRTGGQPGSHTRTERTPRIDLGCSTKVERNLSGALNRVIVRRKLVR